LKVEDHECPTKPNAPELSWRRKSVHTISFLSQPLPTFSTIKPNIKTFFHHESKHSCLVM
jgi:hypothetical protein